MNALLARFSSSKPTELPRPSRANAGRPAGDRVRFKAYAIKQWLLDRIIDAIVHPLRMTGRRTTTQFRAYRFARLSARCLRPFRGRRPAHLPPLEATILNRLITRFNRYEAGFPLLTRLAGREFLEAAENLGQGVIIATVHTQLTLAAHAALRRADKPPLFVGYTTGRDMSGWNWGHSDPLETIEATDALLFRKLRQWLAERRRIVCFVDHSPSIRPADKMAISPNLFAWAEKAGIPLVFMLARLDEFGGIRLELAPGAARNHIGLLDAFIRFIEQKGGWQCEPDRRKSAGAATDRSRL